VMGAQLRFLCGADKTDKIGIGQGHFAVRTQDSCRIRR
jgi:hypothetical protein